MLLLAGKDREADYGLWSVAGIRLRLWSVKVCAIFFSLEVSFVLWC